MKLQSFKTTSQVNEEGSLILRLPPAFANQEVEIVLVIKSKQMENERPIGKYMGKMQMSDDFCESLPDSFWLGE